MLPFPIIVAGLVAGASMTMIDMLFEAAAGGSIWAPTMYVSALVFRPLQTATPPVDFQLDPVLVGLFMQLLGSIFLSYLFAFYVAPRVPPQAIVVAGAAYGAIVFVIVSTLLLPLMNPAIFRLNGPAFGIAHVCWGTMLGAMIERALAAPPSTHPL